LIGEAIQSKKIINNKIVIKMENSPPHSPRRGEVWQTPHSPQRQRSRSACNSHPPLRGGLGGLLSEGAGGRLLDCFAPLAMTGTIKKYPVSSPPHSPRRGEALANATGNSHPPLRGGLGGLSDASLRGAIVGRRSFSTERYIPMECSLMTATKRTDYKSARAVNPPPAPAGGGDSN